MYNEADVVKFEQDLERYERAIEGVEQNQSTLAHEKIVEVLMARDAVQKFIESTREEPSGHLLRLCDLDKRLRSLGPTIAQHVNLTELRATLNRPTDYWWWTFEAPLDAWDRYDWVWNALTAGLLALAASFMFNIYSAFAAGNATVATALSTIAQAAGLAVIGGGAFTVDGQRKVAKILASLNIPPRFHAESTFILALLLFGTIYLTNHSLDDAFFERGNSEYDKGSLTSASLAYRQGLKINPYQKKFHDNLGQVHESLGQLETALEQYLISSEEGEPESLNDLGRIMINRASPITFKADPILAEAYLLMGLQRAQTDEESPPYLYYQLNRNIGWALIQQEEYGDAIEYLEKAMEWRTQVEGYSKEGAMGNCFLAYAYEQQSEEAKATENWQACIDHARPDYVHEYRWLISVGKNDIAYCVNTEKVVAGYNGQRPADVDERCRNLLTEENP